MGESQPCTAVKGKVAYLRFAAGYETYHLLRKTLRKTGPVEASCALDKYRKVFSCWLRSHTARCTNLVDQAKLLPPVSAVSAAAVLGPKGPQ